MAFPFDLVQVDSVEVEEMHIVCVVPDMGKEPSLKITEHIGTCDGGIVERNIHEGSLHMHVIRVALMHE